MCTFAASNGGPAVQLPHRAREAEPEFALADKVVQGTDLSNLVHLTDLQFCCPNPVRPLGYPNRSRLPREHGPAGLDQGGRSGGRSGGQSCSDKCPGQLSPPEQTLVRPPWPGTAAGYLTGGGREEASEEVSWRLPLLGVVPNWIWGQRFSGCFWLIRG